MCVAGQSVALARDGLGAGVPAQPEAQVDGGGHGQHERRHDQDELEGVGSGGADLDPGLDRAGLERLEFEVAVKPCGYPVERTLADLELLPGPTLDSWPAAADCQAFGHP